jgi:hypothetical protein
MNEPISVNFNPQQVQALYQLLDGGVRHLGLNAVHATSAILSNIEFAKAQAATEAQPEAQPEAQV